MGSNEPLFLRVAEQIEQFVAGNGLAPGDRLPGERELCDLLGVSRASVREALRSLETRGRGPGPARQGRVRGRARRG